jgi:Helicase HerA, central domain
MPNHYVLARLEVLGELRNGSMFGTATRPLPKSIVQDLSADDIQQLIGIGGDMVLGTLSSYERVIVTMDSKSKKVLPRNVGIFGTVGSGKTNSSQVLIEEAVQAGYAVVVLDVEGEYTAMDEPTAEKALIPKLETCGRKPAGIKDFHVYHPTGGEPSRPNSTEFGVPFASLTPHVISEIAQLTEPQEGVFLAAHEGESGKHAKKAKPSFLSSRPQQTT